MSAHVPDDILHDFVMGDLDEQVAIHVATHLDGCPHCATRAAHLEPLAVAFAAVDDPLVPDGLVDSVLLAVQEERRQRLPAIEVAIGVALLAIAGVLVALGSDPIALMADSIGAVPRLSQLLAQSSTSLLTFGLALALFVIGSTVALRRSLQRSP